MMKDLEDAKLAELLKTAGSVPGRDDATLAAFMARLHRIPDDHAQARASAAAGGGRSFLGGLFAAFPRPWILAEGGALAAALCLGLFVGYDAGLSGAEQVTDLDLSTSLIAGTDIDLFEDGTL
ncbi:hypothetical protein [Gimibacter soli]|uniref:DUF3619 family protein n=1 Tax=Gimibacter soli TaxID=3024400 RepID=A0AAF0BKQ7_9PROT|nr:hypothetical protein [Gimibacter soli]WCL54554.1 hypothetical protein PH603_02125 [Gimibacter soli]